MHFRLVFLTVACAVFLCQCGGHKPGDPPRGKNLPQFFGVFLWDGKLEQLQGGQVLWRAGGRPMLDGIVLYDSALAGGGARPEDAVTLIPAIPLRKEIEYFYSGSGDNLARVEVRQAAGFLEKGGRLALKIMPLEKPGAFMVVPETRLEQGLYVLEFMGKRHRFAIGMASPEDVSMLAGRSQDRVLRTRLASGGLFGASRNTRLGEFTRDPGETDREALSSLKTAQEAWKNKNYEMAIPAAILALGYHPGEKALVEIALRGRLTASKEALEAGRHAEAVRWAEQAVLHDEDQRMEAEAIMKDARLLPILGRATAALEQNNFQAAREALNEAPFDLRTDARFETLQRDLRLAEETARIQAAMDGKQWDQALELAGKAVDDGVLSPGPANGWISRIRAGAAADRRYYGKLHQPVWEVKLGEGEMRMHGMRKVPGADLVVVSLSDGRDSKRASFAALKASTGEVQWTAPFPGGRLVRWSEDGRYAVIGDSENGFQSPENCFVVDVREGKRLAGTQRPWPARHSEPVAVHGGKGLFAVGVRSRDLVVEIIDLGTGEVRRRIAPKGIRGEDLSSYREETSFARAMCFSVDGGKLLTFSEDHTLRVFDVSTGEQIGNGVAHRDGLSDGYFHLSNDGQRVIHEITGLLSHTVFRSMGAGSREISLTNILALHPGFEMFLGDGGMFAAKNAGVLTLTQEGAEQQTGEIHAPFGMQCAAFDETDHVVFVAGGGGYVARLAVTPPKEGDDAVSPKNAPGALQIDSALAGRLVQFVTAHQARTDQRDVDGLMADYADKVDYYGFGMIDPSQLREKLRDMFGKTGKRSTTVKHQPEPRLEYDGSIRLEYPVLVQEEGKENRELLITLDVRLQTQNDEIKIVRKKSMVKE